jgi:hypothetical protein
MTRALLAVVLAFSVALAGAGRARASAASQPGEITMITDSVMTAVLWNPAPLAQLENGFSNVDMEVGICRTLTGESCLFQGQRVPTLVDLVQSLGNQIGDTVVVEVGYNDPVATFTTEFQQSVQTLLAAGVKRILWVNYHVWDPQYATMDTMLAQAAKAYPQVTIVDWESDSALQYNWFQGDGIHLVYPGAVALAKLVNVALKETVTPLTVQAPSVEHARVGQSVSVPLEATGGVAPYQWQVTVRGLPRGLHLLASGLLEGVPKSRGDDVVHLLVTDSAGRTARKSLTLVTAAAV